MEFGQTEWGMPINFLQEIAAVPEKGTKRITQKGSARLSATTTTTSSERILWHMNERGQWQAGVTIARACHSHLNVT